jgi:four helix bundle protein
VTSRILGYRDLIVWQRAIQLFVVVTRLVRALSAPDRLVFEVQTRKAARSVSANISEGHERHDLGDYLRHLSFAQASLAEVENDLVLIGKTTVHVQDQLQECSTHADEVGRMLTTLSANLRKRWRRRRVRRSESE